MGQDNMGYERDVEEKKIHECQNGTADAATLKEQEAMGTQGYDVSKNVDDVNKAVEIPVGEDGEMQAEVEEEEDPWNIVPLFRKKEVTPWDGKSAVQIVFVSKVFLLSS